MRIHDQQTNAECEVLGVNRSAYSAGLTPGRSAQAARDAKLPPLVRDLFWTHRRRDGTRRIVAELAERGESCGTRRVTKLRKTPGLSALQPKSFVPETTDSRHRRGDRPNLLPDLPTLTAIHSEAVRKETACFQGTTVTAWRGRALAVAKTRPRKAVTVAPKIQSTNQLRPFRVLGQPLTASEVCSRLCPRPPRARGLRR